LIAGGGPGAQGEAPVVIGLCAEPIRPGEAPVVIGLCAEPIRPGEAPAAGPRARRRPASRSSPPRHPGRASRVQLREGP